MSKELGYKQVKNVESRRTWDRDYYEAKAKERIEKGDDYQDKDEGGPSRRSHKEEFQPAAPGAAGPAGSARAYLKTREKKVDLTSKLGKTQVVTAASTPSQQGGWYCETCKCGLKDSINYLDHINGKKHQRELGFSMRVERSTVTQVKDRLKMHKQREEDRISGALRKPSAEDEFDSRVRESEDNEERRKRQKKEAKRSAKRKQQEEEEAMEFQDPDMAAMMGFGGFGGGSKKT
ncbi:unnamed protein product [Hapterophycus canaliculatus]